QPAPRQILAHGQAIRGLHVVTVHHRCQQHGFGAYCCILRAEAATLPLILRSVLIRPVDVIGPRPPAAVHAHFFMPRLLGARKPRRRDSAIHRLMVVMGMSGLASLSRWAGLSPLATST